MGMVSARGFGGMNVNLTTFGSMDEGKMPPPKVLPEECRPKLSYWPSGGGAPLDHPRRGFFISGTWNEWGAQKMDEDDGVYEFTVTLGENRWEQFVIMLDGDETRVLHPNRYKAPKGGMVVGPESVGIRESTWLIDGRSQHAAYERVTDESALGIDGDAAVAATAEQPASSDEGRPGTQYRVRLHISGKWRAVSWARIGLAESLHVPTGRYYLFGSWSSWSIDGCIEMEAVSPGVFIGSLTLHQGAIQFLVLRNRDMGQVIYPLAENAHMDAPVVGPDDLIHQGNWLLRGMTGDVFRIELRIGGERPRISWTKSLLLQCEE